MKGKICGVVLGVLTAVATHSQQPRWYFYLGKVGAGVGWGYSYDSDLGSYWSPFNIHIGGPEIGFFKGKLGLGLGTLELYWIGKNEAGCGLFVPVKFFYTQLLKGNLIVYETSIGIPVGGLINLKGAIRYVFVPFPLETNWHIGCYYFQMEWWDEWEVWGFSTALNLTIGAGWWFKKFPWERKAPTQSTRP